MQKTDFQTTAHAKCILAGEHSVLRGYPAIVLPVRKKFMTLTYQHSNSSLEIVNHSENEKLPELFLAAFSKALKLLGVNGPVVGTFIFKTNMMIGNGIGFSSVVCVAISRWAVWKRLVAETELFSFARDLEDQFHGKSSGIDIAGVLSDRPILFQNSKVCQVSLNWKPQLYLTYSGHLKKTEEAIRKVSELNALRPNLANSLDHDMEKSVLLAEKALQMDEEEGLELLITAIKLAGHCFQEWKLVTPQMQDHINQLKQLGALAVKPTGAGLGGYVLSLWKDSPSRISAAVKVLEEFYT